jgi:hypothetical protein
MPVDKINPQPIPQQESGTTTKTTTATPAAVEQAAPTLPTRLPLVGGPTTSTEGLRIPEDWFTKVEARLKEVKTFYDKYAGKVGCNPYPYYNKFIKPLEDAVATFNNKFEFELPALDTEGNYITEDVPNPNNHPSLVGRKQIKCKRVNKETYSIWLYNSTMALEMKEGYALHDREAFDAENLRAKTTLEDKKAGRKSIIIQ